MNLDVLKDLFLIGNEDDVNAFVATLKPRCIQTSSYTVEENGVDVVGLTDEELIEQSEVFELKKTHRYLIVEV